MNDEPKLTLEARVSIDRIMKKLLPSINSCVELVGRGYAGRHQLHKDSFSYCTESMNYCPLQKDCSMALKQCQGNDYCNELAANHPRND